jgi:hypothetical protein
MRLQWYAQLLVKSECMELGEVSTGEGASEFITTWGDNREGEEMWCAVLNEGMDQRAKVCLGHVVCVGGWELGPIGWWYMRPRGSLVRYEYMLYDSLLGRAVLECVHERCDLDGARDRDSAEAVDLCRKLDAAWNPTEHTRRLASVCTC